MEPASRRLRDALVAAFRPYLIGILSARGWPEASPANLDSAESWLAASLDELLARPFSEQRRGPLEVFQEAMSGPNAALTRAAVTAPQREEAAIAALPGDRYDLAPASSAVLGEEAWQAHLAWGVVKAAAITRPACGVLSTNLLDLDRIERAAATAGYRCERVPDHSAVSGQAVVFVDLEHPVADDVIRAAAGRGIRVVAYGPHVDDLALVRARSLGAADAVARSRFFADPGGFLPTYG